MADRESTFQPGDFGQTPETLPHPASAAQSPAVSAPGGDAGYPDGTPQVLSVPGDPGDPAAAGFGVASGTLPEIQEPLSGEDEEEDDEYYDEEGDEDDPFADFDVEGVDLDDGLNRLGGNEDLYIEVIETYVRFTGKVLDQVKDPPSSEGLKDYAVLVHGIKGSSYNIGATLVGKSAEAQEHAAKAGDLHKVLEFHESFLAVAHKLVDDLQAFLDRAAPSEEGEKDTLPEPPKDVLGKILAACGTFDMDSMEECVAELEKHAYETGGDLVPWLREQMENLEYDAIVERLEKELGAEG
jgi:HPt (histidine-containing phosphotransfer) domain-containing protein